MAERVGFEPTRIVFLAVSNSAKIPHFSLKFTRKVNQTVPMCNAKMCRKMCRFLKTTHHCSKTIYLFPSEVFSQLIPGAPDNLSSIARISLVRLLCIRRSI